MNLIITPHVGIEPIKFGMLATEIRQILNTSFTSSIPAPYTPNRDHFKAIGITIAYNLSSTCQAIILYPPANPIFQCVNLLGGQSIKNLKSWFESINGLIEVQDEVVVISHQFGIAMTTEFYDAFKDEPPTGIVVFSGGYYNADENRSPNPNY